MAEKTVLVTQQLLKPIKVTKWKVSSGNSISIGSVILLYDFEGAKAAEQRKLKSTRAGTVHELIAPEGAIVRPGQPLLKLQACIHPTVMKDMCAECGADLRMEETLMTASVPMVHSIPDLKVSEELAQKLGRADGERLLRDRKLVLLVDLDQTLIHTTNDNIPVNIKDVYHFQLYGPNSPWYHTRLRPGTHQFLSNVSPFFELHICTFGARNYAHMITMFLDGDQRYFSNRILSRDECFDPTSKKANLKALFPCGDNMVCIIDDREDVWNHASNLIHVKPYHFFQHTGDINAPPGLDKHEQDDKEGFDLSKIKKKPTKPNGKNVNNGEKNGVMNKQNTEIKSDDSEKVEEKSCAEECEKMDVDCNDLMENKSSIKIGENKTEGSSENVKNVETNKDDSSNKKENVKNIVMNKETIVGGTNKESSDKKKIVAENVEMMEIYKESSDKKEIIADNVKMVEMNKEEDSGKKEIIAENVNKVGINKEENSSKKEIIADNVKKVEINKEDNSDKKQIIAEDVEMIEINKEGSSKMNAENVKLVKINNENTSDKKEMNAENVAVNKRDCSSDNKYAKIIEINKEDSSEKKKINADTKSSENIKGNSSNKKKINAENVDTKSSENIKVDSSNKTKINAENVDTKSSDNNKVDSSTIEGKINAENDETKVLEISKVDSSDKTNINVEKVETKILVDSSDKIKINIENVGTKISENVETKSSEINKVDSSEMTAENVEMVEINKDAENVENKISEESFEKPKSMDIIDSKKSDEMIEIEDPDDYLLHLEDILRRIHKTFYEEYDRMESGIVPDLKRVIPDVRSKVLQGTKLVFSGLVPTHVKLQQSKAYQVARSLGAVVTQDLDAETTHLVAVRPGTAKVNAGRRKKNLKIVTPDWLWACAERWEHVEESIFPLNSKGSKNRHPPPHCSSPDHVVGYPTHEAPGTRKRTPSGRFMDTINPLMSFSSDDIADMDKEVEDILDDESDESEDESQKQPNIPEPPVPQLQPSIPPEEESSSSSEESLTGEYPRGFKRTRDKRKLESFNNMEEENEIESSLDEFPSAKFRRGEQLDSDLDIGQESNSEGSVEAPDEVDDGEWNMMGAALEREFLSNN